ncbi:hypothetical protein DPEC_G00040140 [Dallia pectoralis]|uniref:Uncharacterized protein n=1 Tax=Dallia pectoralis TaxID=75939 RepID=A0ACC2HFE8_DALPE|nr:hypothetical protein DPEC_G00040140 [Dallia pectoralis]
MNDKPKIYVFMGAPPAPLTPVPNFIEVEPAPSTPWRTMKLYSQEGFLMPREDDEGGVHGCDGRGCVESSTEHSNVPRTSQHHPKPHHSSKNQIGSSLEIEPRSVGTTQFGLDPLRRSHALNEPTRAGLDFLVRSPALNEPTRAGLDFLVRSPALNEPTRAGLDFLVRSPALNEPTQAGLDPLVGSPALNEPTQAGLDPLVGSPALNEPAGNDEDVCSESVREYLDSCFPAGQPDPGPVSTPVRADVQSDLSPSPALSVETEYLSAWTVSQALVLRGRLSTQPDSNPLKARPPPTKTTLSTHAASSSPELYSPATQTQSPTHSGPGGTQQGSLELFYEPLLSESQEERGVVLEAIAEGVICSQSDHSKNLQPSLKTPSGASPSPPAPKRSRVSSSVAGNVQPPDQPVDRARVSPKGTTTVLAECVSLKGCFSILVAVVYPCHLKEIRVRSGASAGTCIPLASLVVTDQSAVEMKVVLWRRAAFWALTVYPGDVLLITGLVVNRDKWRGETVLQSSYSSRLLNLGQVTGSHSPPVPQNVSGQTLKLLCGYLREKHSLLVSLPHRSPQNPNAISHSRLRNLKPDTLVHALLRVTHTQMISAWRAEAEGVSRTGGILKAVLTAEQGDGQQGAVVLWGAALTWLQRINRKKDAVWEFRVLLVRENMTSGLLELHSTPWGSCEPIFPDDIRVLEFYRTDQAKYTISSLEMDLHTLLSQKYTGDVELRVHITAFQFQVSPSQNALQRMDNSTSLEKILDTVSGDVTFTGCGRCTAELDTDDNGIYCPCYPCLPHLGVRRYYRPVLLTVKDGERQLCVRVQPVLLQKILLNTPPDKLSKTVAPGSDVKLVQVVADRIYSLLSLPRRKFLLTVRSHFVCDENSVPTAQDFLLMDLQDIPSLT